MPQPKPATSFSQHHPIILITLVALVMRLWGVKQYVPRFWDEAQYLTEVEKLAPFFSVNVGTYAFLKLAHFLIGGLLYPQIVSALFGLFVIVGLYSLGRRIAVNQSDGILLGSLMAGQAAFMPYFVTYSRTALTEGFALAFFVLAINVYCTRATQPKGKAKHSGFSPTTLFIASAIALAMASACSFKFLIPTILLYLSLETVLLWTAPRAKDGSSGLAARLTLSLLGLTFFFVVPVLLTFISGYSGWIERAVSLSEWHSAIGSFRLALQFLFPLHLYYLAGIPFILFSLCGFVLTIKNFFGTAKLVRSGAGIILTISFFLYALFFGLFSHLQGSRMYLLAMPPLVVFSSQFLIAIPNLIRRHETAMRFILTLILILPMSYATARYLSTSSGLRPASDAIAQNLKPMGLVYANAKSQINYCTFRSPFRRVPFGARSFIYDYPQVIPHNDSLLVVINDGSDVTSIIASWDKSDHLSSIDSTMSMLANRRMMTLDMKRIYQGEDDFFATPFYYLEDLYSWKGYFQLEKILQNCNDSIYVYK